MRKLLLICILFLLIGCSGAEEHPYRLVQMQNGEYVIQKKFGFYWSTWTTYHGSFRYNTEEEAMKAYNSVIKTYIGAQQAHTVKKVIRE